MQQYQESFRGTDQQQEQPTDGTVAEEQPKIYKDPNYPGILQS